MLKDMTKELKTAILDNDKLVLENYTMKDGVYIKLDINNPISICEENYIIIDNKKQQDVIKKKDLYDWFNSRDYCSYMIDTNKVIGAAKTGRTIHSTNYMTLFVKREYFPGLSGKCEVSTDIFKNYLKAYYKDLSIPEGRFTEMIPEKPKKNSKEDLVKKHFPFLVDYMRSNERKNSIKAHFEYILGNLDVLIKLLKEFSKSNEFTGYVKLFFNTDIDIYKKESDIYTIPRIFNVNKYNTLINDQIYGLPSINMTTNDNKPYLILKSMKCKIPMISTVEDIKVTQTLFNWLRLQGLNKEIKINYDYKFNGDKVYTEDRSYFSVYLTLVKNKMTIDDFDYIPFKQPRINFQFDNILQLNEYVDYKDKSKGKIKINYDSINSLFLLKKLLCEYLFNNKKLADKYLKDYEPDISTNEFTPTMKVLFMYSRDAMHDYFSKGVDLSFKKIINKLTMDLIEAQLKKTVKGTDIAKIAKTYNLRLSLLKYFKSGEVEKLSDNIKRLLDKSKSKLESKELVVCESDEEFYFVAGQLAYYIIDKSEASDKNFGIFEPILLCKNSKQLKRRLEEAFETYKHAILTINVKFKNAMSMVMGYDTQAKIEGDMKDILLAGLLSNNFIK
ncbi:hypothetical protein LN736_08795 [Clostridium sp. WLY-B-L2]|uniref:Uncharacterized protein n=1 Tax=Clostridium aromativorans TaxID=2836848 RepID=A0ABS8N559_9CLOT|nr:hypothetical protein [Clostridium aromativorans]MCC9294951.1 hypothetical protein [Clostridium aromativorans]